MVVSDIVEGFLNVAKNSQQVKGSKHYRKPQRSMATGIAREVVSKEFNYEKVDRC